MNLELINATVTMGMHVLTTRYGTESWVAAPTLLLRRRRLRQPVPKVLSEIAASYYSVGREILSASVRDRALNLKNYQLK